MINKLLKRLRIQLQKLIRYLKELYYWLIEPFRLLFRFFGLPILVLLSSMGIIWWTGISETKIRVLGWLFQLLGTGTVVCEIQQQLNFFNVSNPIKDWGKDWINRVPSLNRTITLSSILREELSIRDELRIVRKLQTSGKTREERIKILEKEMNQILEELEQKDEKINNLEKSNNKALEEEKQARKSADEELKEQLKDAQTKSLHVPINGVILLLAGTTLSTLSKELNELFS